MAGGYIFKYRGKNICSLLEVPTLVWSHFSSKIMEKQKNQYTMPCHANILVVGAGIIGLTTSIRLAEAGYSVTVLAQEVPSTILTNEGDVSGKRKQGTYTSSGSGGLWMPFLLDGDKIEKWARTTFLEYQSILSSPNIDAHSIGVFLKSGLLLSATKTPVLPWYADITEMKIVKKADDDRIPVGYKGALCFSTPILQMELYLPYLERRARALNVNFHPLPGRTWTLTEARKFGMERNIEILVNCTGVHAASFLESAGDLGTFPGRGILAFIKRPSFGSKTYFITEDPEDGILSKNGTLAYALPRGNEIYTLGGTIFKGDWNESTTESEISGVVERACKLLQINHNSVQIVSRWCGLRPMTSEGSARVCRNNMFSDVIDNYGHGGSGVTTCWGCAEAVVEIVNDIQKRRT